MYIEKNKSIQTGRQLRPNPLSSPSRLMQFKRGVLKAAIIPLLLTQLAIVPASYAVTAVYKSVGTNLGPSQVALNVFDAEIRLLNILTWEPPGPVFEGANGTSAREKPQSLLKRLVDSLFI